MASPRVLASILSIYASVDLCYRIFCAVDIFVTPGIDHSFKNTFYMCLHYMSASLDIFLLYGIKIKHIDYLKAFKLGFLVLIPLLALIRIYYSLEKPEDGKNIITACWLSLFWILVLYPCILRMLDGFVIALRNGYDQSLDYSESVEPSPDPEKISLV